jgi:hypothetical protein
MIFSNYFYYGFVAAKWLWNKWNFWKFATQPVGRTACLDFAKSSRMASHSLPTLLILNIYEKTAVSSDFTKPRKWYRLFRF